MYELNKIFAHFFDLERMKIKTKPSKNVLILQDLKYLEVRPPIHLTDLLSSIEKCLKKVELVSAGV